MKNKKGFTLVELLGVIVVISILLALAAVSIIRYVDLSRKKTFVEDARTIIASTKENYLSGKYEATSNVVTNGDRVTYSMEAVQGTLDKKLGMGPFNSKYVHAGAVMVRTVSASGNITTKYYVCLIDADGHGFDYTDIEKVDIDTIASDNTNLTGCTDEAIPTQDSTPTDPEVQVYQVKYMPGNGGTVSNMPSAQTKQQGTSITLSSQTPKSTTLAFLGWSTTQNATVSSVWYDPSTVYTADKDLTLYAQWYDVNALEMLYTTFVHYNDFTSASGVDKGVGESGTYYKVYNFEKRGVTGYKKIGRYDYVSGDTKGRLFRVRNTRIAVRPIDLDNPLPSNPSINHLYVLKRTAATYPSDAVDSRIYRLLLLRDESLKLSEIRGVASSVIDNISVSAKSTKSGTYSLPSSESNYKIIAVGGFNLSNASSDGEYVSRVSINKYTISSNGTSISYRILNSDPSKNAKVKLQLQYVEILKSKSVTVTGYTPNSKSTKGASRLETLIALNNATKDYFTSKEIYETPIHKTDLNAEAWSHGDMECTVTVPTGSTQRINGKILAVTGYGVNDNDVAKRYCSFASIGKSYIGSLNATSSLLKIRFYGGNQSYGKADGTKITDITAYGYVFYIGSGKIVPTSPCGYEIDDETD